MSGAPRDDAVTVAQHPERARYDRATIDAILDAALVCHVALTLDDQPFAIPMGFARRGDHILLHGALNSRLLSALAAGAPCCVTVTHLDGLVLARSALHHSMNYRSAMIQGRCSEITAPGEKRLALDRIVEHLVPGRSIEIRPMTDAEVEATRVLSLPLSSASAKIRSGPPVDAAKNIDPQVWSGVLPIALRADSPIAAADVGRGVPAPPSITTRLRRLASQADDKACSTHQPRVRETSDRRPEGDAAQP